MMISNLSQELQTKIFFYAVEHPCAKIIKDEYNEHYHEEIENFDFKHCYFSLVFWEPCYCWCCQKHGRLIHCLNDGDRMCASCYKKTKERRFNKRSDHTYVCPLFRSLFREWKHQYKLTKLKISYILL